MINTHLQAHRPTHSSVRSRLALVAGAAFAWALFAGPIYAATEAKPSPQKPQREQLTIAAKRRRSRGPATSTGWSSGDSFGY